MKNYFLIFAMIIPLSGFSQWTQMSNISGKQKVNESVAHIKSEKF